MIIDIDKKSVPLDNNHFKNISIPSCFVKQRARYIHVNTALDEFISCLARDKNLMFY